MVDPVRVRKISVAVDGANKYQSVSSVDGLAGLLLSDKWPDAKKDRSWRRALAQCLTVMESQTGGTTARKAFVAAAREAGFRVLPDDELKLRSAKRTQRFAHPPSSALPPRH